MVDSGGDFPSRECQDTDTTAYRININSSITWISDRWFLSRHRKFKKAARSDLHRGSPCQENYLGATQTSKDNRIGIGTMQDQ